MKLSVVQENFNKALSIVSRIIPSRVSLPVLANVLLKTESSRLIIAATNLEMAVVCRIGAKVETDGSITVPGKMLTELINGLENDKVQLITSDQNLKIKATKLDSRLNGIKAEDFPVIPDVKPKSKFTIPAAPLATALSEVIASAATDEARPVLNGVLFIAKEKKITLAATDSYRLSETSIEVASTKPFNVIVPVRAVHELMRIITSASGDVTIELTDNEAVFRIEEITLITRLIEGNYPDYSQIFPSKPTTTATLSKDELQKAVRIASLFTRESANTVKLSFKNQTFTITSSASEVGENNINLDAKITGEPLEIQLNARYIADVLNAISTPSVSLELTEDISPCIIRPVITKKESHPTTHIIMPLRS